MKKIWFIIIVISQYSCFLSNEEKRHEEDLTKIVTEWIQKSPRLDRNYYKVKSNNKSIQVFLRDTSSIWSNLLNIQAADLVHTALKRCDFLSKYDTLHVTYGIDKPIVTYHFTSKEVSNIVESYSSSRLVNLKKYMIENLDHRSSKLYEEATEVLKEYGGKNRKEHGIYVLIDYAYHFDNPEPSHTVDSLNRGMDILKMMINETQKGDVLEHFNAMIDIIENPSNQNEIKTKDQ